VPQTVADVLQVGDVARFRLLQSGELRLGQVPAVQGALVSLDPTDGAVSALSGGFDFFLSNYNRAVQSQRQPGSAFKPFVYSAALERGFTAASIFNDAPIVQRSRALEGVWRPENYSGRFNGPTRLREALIKSLNLVSIRVIERSGVRHTVEHVRGFGFDETASPMNSTLALGSGGVAPLDLVQGYAVFANGGYRVDPYLIERIEGADGEVLYAASPELACLDCDESGEVEPKLIHGSIDLYAGTRHAPRAISAQNAYLMNDMMQDVVRRGTGVRAYRELGRTDLRGKTGTTNDQRDAWFAGFNGDVVTAAWVGFDQERSLGNGEQGARTALPMWISYMSEALDGMPLHAMERPPGIVDVRINPNTGLVASTRDSSIFEKFRMDYVPESEPTRLELPQDPVMGEFVESDRTETTVPGSIF
jgi:penicillin-binding protein 1A